MTEKERNEKITALLSDVPSVYLDNCLMALEFTEIYSAEFMLELYDVAIVDKAKFMRMKVLLEKLFVNNKVTAEYLKDYRQEFLDAFGNLALPHFEPQLRINMSGLVPRKKVNPLDEWEE